QADAAFFDALKSAGRLQELSTALETVLRDALEARDDADARRLDLLERYYGADDPTVAARRRGADRFVLYRASDRLGAHALVARLASVAPEVGEVVLERIGGADGPLVLRTEEQVAGVQDDYEDALDTDEIDLRDLDETPSTSVRGLVAAMNTLLDRAGVLERFVPLPMDEGREAYIGVVKAAALTLHEAGYLELAEEAALRELSGW
ncbi:MAG: hypothetical protein AAF447_06845, partial [Myxococcota bacterium]